MPSTDALFVHALRRTRYVADNCAKKTEASKATITNHVRVLVRLYTWTPTMVLACGHAVKCQGRVTPVRPGAPHERHPRSQQRPSSPFCPATDPESERLKRFWEGLPRVFGRIWPDEVDGNLLDQRVGRVLRRDQAALIQVDTGGRAS